MGLVTPPVYPDRSANLDSAECVLLSALRWWVADHRRGTDPLPRLCQALGDAGAHDAAFSVHQLMASSHAVRASRSPFIAHAARSYRTTRNICCMPRAWCRVVMRR